jgi:hypothetical protein
VCRFGTELTGCAAPLSPRQGFAVCRSFSPQLALSAAFLRRFAAEIARFLLKNAKASSAFRSTPARRAIASRQIIKEHLLLVDNAIYLHLIWYTEAGQEKTGWGGGCFELLCVNQSLAESFRDQTE